jgi:hypothetical protein
MTKKRVIGALNGKMSACPTYEIFININARVKLYWKKYLDNWMKESMSYKKIFWVKPTNSAKIQYRVFWHHEGLLALIPLLSTPAPGDQTQGAVWLNLQYLRSIHPELTPVLAHVLNMHFSCGTNDSDYSISESPEPDHKTVCISLHRYDPLYLVILSTWPKSPVHVNQPPVHVQEVLK